MRTEPFSSWFTFQDNAVFGCQIAVRAWGDRSLRYAIEKYRLSLELDSFTPHSASPRSGQVFVGQYAEYRYHVSAATAVLVAFCHRGTGPRNQIELQYLKILLLKRMRSLWTAHEPVKKAFYSRRLPMSVRVLSYLLLPHCASSLNYEIHCLASNGNRSFAGAYWVFGLLGLHVS